MCRTRNLVLVIVFVLLAILVSVYLIRETCLRSRCSERELVEHYLPRVDYMIQAQMRDIPHSQVRYPLLDSNFYLSPVFRSCRRFEYYLVNCKWSGTPGYAIVFAAWLPSGSVFVSTHDGAHLVVKPDTFEYGFLFGHSAIWWFFHNHGKLPIRLEELEDVAPYVRSVSKLCDEFGRLPYYAAIDLNTYAYFSLGQDGIISDDDIWFPCAEYPSDMTDKILLPPFPATEY